MGISEFKYYISQRPEAVSNDNLLLAILSDAMCNDQKKYRALLNAYKAGIWEAIKLTNPPEDHEQKRIILELQSQYGLAEKAAEFAVCFWVQSFEGFSFSGINGITSYMGLPIPNKDDLSPIGPQLVNISCNLLGGVSLRWARHPDADSYEVWRSVDKDKAKMIEQGTFAMPRFTDKNIEPGKLHSYVIRSRTKSSGVMSQFSNVLQIAVPDIKSDFEIRDIRVTDKGYVRLLWSYQAGATEYFIKRKDPFTGNTDAIFKIPNSQFEFTDNTVSVGSPLSYVLECERRDQPALSSTEVTLTV